MVSYSLLLFWVSRPLLLPGVPLIFLLGVYLASGSLVELPPAGIFQLIILTFPLNILLYGLNDIYDFESDQKNPLKGKGFGEVLLPKHHDFIFKAASISGLLIITAAFFTFSVTNVILSLLMVILAAAYSVPPIRLKTRPPLDSLVNGLGYCLLPLALGFTYFRPLVEIPVEVLLISITVMGAHMYSSIRDFAYDKEAGERTISIALGKRTTAFLASITVLIPLVYLVRTEGSVPPIVFLTSALVISIMTIIWPNENFVSKSVQFLFFVFIICIGWLLFIIG